MTRPLDRERLSQAFERLGQDLARRGLLVELAVYRGGALLLQFEWRRSTEDVDAVVRAGFDERLLAPSVEVVAAEMELDANWLNNAVGMYTAPEEDETRSSRSAGAIRPLETWVSGCSSPTHATCSP